MTEIRLTLIMIALLIAVACGVWIDDSIRGDRREIEFYESSFEGRIVSIKDLGRGLREVKVNSFDSSLHFSDLNFYSLEIENGNYLTKEPKSMILKVKRNGRVKEYTYQR